jgi:rubredoxin
LKNDLAWESSFAKWRIRDGRFGVDLDLQRAALDMFLESFNRGEITSLDGVTSAMSAAIRTEHGDRHFEMNSNWILSPQDWVCPCCGRDKLAVSRVGSKGQILCKSVVHHDHMGDVIKEEFCRAFVGEGTQEPQVEGQRLVDRIGGAFSAYEEVLVCEDCNNADSRAKRELGLPGAFSFSVGQMARFIVAKPHEPHEIVVERAKEVWEEARPAYELRMELIGRVAHAAATDAHWYEPHSRDSIPVPVFGHADARLSYGNLEQLLPMDSLLRALGPTEQLHKADRARWRQTKSKPGKPLPENYLAMLLSVEHMARWWTDTPEDWRCLVCQRTKYEQVYLGAQGAIQFRVVPTTQNPVWRRRKICNHCHSTAMSLKEEVTEAAGRRPHDTFGYFSPEELRGIIHPRPHSAHLIKVKEAAELVAMAIERVQDELFEGDVF